jgi:hypothetical protein
MGIPYSRQINAAFDQVTPLVEEGFIVLQKTKNISLLLAVIQVLTVLFLGLILIALLAVLVSINPGLEEERDLLVTPVLRAGCEVLGRVGRGVMWLFWTGVVGGLAGAGAGIWWVGVKKEDGVEEVVGKDGEGVDGGEEKSGREDEEKDEQEEEKEKKKVQKGK